MENTYWLRNRDVAFEIARFGATLQRFEVEGRNILLSRPDPTKPSAEYLGATCGRYANRIAGGVFSIGESRYQLDQNQGSDLLHGGSGGFSQCLWDVEQANPEQVILKLTSPDGDMGFPGEVRAQAIFTLLAAGVQLEYQATTTADTVISMTLHPYFNLNGDGRGTVDEHLLRIFASAYTPVDDHLIPCGEIRELAGTALDFRTPRAIGLARAEVIAAGMQAGEGFDHNFIIDGTELCDCVELSGPHGLKLVTRSDAPAVQIFDGHNLDGSQTSPEGYRYYKFGGLAIEPQSYPDAPNHPNFPSTLLRPGERYQSTIQYLIS